MPTVLPRGVTVLTHRSGVETLYVTFTYRGVRCRESLHLAPSAKNVRYAENLLAEIKSRISRQTFAFSEYFPESKTNAAKLFGQVRSRITVKQLLDETVWADVVPKLTTAYTYKKDAKWAREALGHIPVQDLSVKDVRDWVKSMPQLSRKTINNRMTPLRLVLSIAVDDELIHSNPCDAVTLGKKSKGLLTREQRSAGNSADPFSLEEIDKILTAAGQYHIKAQNYFQLAFFTGMRHSELAGLKWDSVDLVNNTVEVREALVSVGGHAHEQTPKTHAGNRVINLNPRAIAALRAQQALTRFAKGYVFTRFSRSDKPITHNNHYYDAWGTILKAANVRYRPPKQTRHTFASQMLSHDETPAYIVTQLGHMDLSMLYHVYGRYIKNKNTAPKTSNFGA